MLQNGFSWARVIREVFVEEIRTFGQTLKDRILKAFADVEQEADKLKKEEYRRLLQAPASEDGGPGMDVLAERAEDEAIDFYISMTDLKQGIINMFSVAFHELFRQQLMNFHRKELLEWHEEHNQKLWTMDEIRNRLSHHGIDITSFGSYKKVFQELRRAANVVKYGEGEASENLRKIRPDLFLAPPGSSYKPLAGQGLVISSDDIASYTKAIEEFWEELASVLEKQS